MDTLEALITLGMLGSLDPKATKKPDLEKFKAEAEAKRDEARRAARAFAVKDAKRQAESAKTLYDAFVEIGFSEVQAFELLKETFILV